MNWAQSYFRKYDQYIYNFTPPAKMVDYIPESRSDQSAWQLLRLGVAIKSHLDQILTLLNLEVADLKQNNWLEAGQALVGHACKASDASAINWDGMGAYWRIPSPPPILTASQFDQLRAAFNRLRADGLYFGTIFRLVGPHLDSAWLLDEGWPLILEILLMILPAVIPDPASSIQIEPLDYIITTMLAVPSIQNVFTTPTLQSNFGTLVNFWHTTKSAFL